VPRWESANRLRSTPGNATFAANAASLRAYLKAIGADCEEILPQTSLAPSRLERIWNEQYAASGRNIVRDYVRLSDLEAEDLEWFADREDLELTPNTTRKAPFRDSLQSMKRL